MLQYSEINYFKQIMDANTKIDQEQIPVEQTQIESIELLKETTKTSILDAFYRDEWVFGKVFSIITGKKVNPSDLIANLQTIRTEFKEAENDEEFKQAA